MNKPEIYPEHHDCEKGEVNRVTKEIYCNAYQDFCKFIGNCKEKR